MHPFTYTQSLARNHLRDEVFVAMPFAPCYDERFQNVICPAIAALSLQGGTLVPKRVDISQSGDSILTEIMDGIVHSRLVLADVSCVGRDAVSSKHFRNENVLYEVGLALALRPPAAVLLVKDDDLGFLFDVSSIPHAKIDFTDQESAQSDITKLLQARLDEADFVEDFRMSKTLDSLDRQSVQILMQLRGHPWGTWNHEKAMVGAGPTQMLELGLCRFVDANANHEANYGLTEFGKQVLTELTKRFPRKQQVKVNVTPPSDE